MLVVWGCGEPSDVVPEPQTIPQDEPSEGEETVESDDVSFEKRITNVNCNINSSFAGEIQLNSSYTYNESGYISDFERYFKHVWYDEILADRTDKWRFIYTEEQLTGLSLWLSPENYSPFIDISYDAFDRVNEVNFIDGINRVRWQSMDYDESGRISKHEYHANQHWIEVNYSYDESGFIVLKTQVATFDEGADAARGQGIPFVQSYEYRYVWENEVLTEIELNKLDTDYSIRWRYSYVNELLIGVSAEVSDWESRAYSTAYFYDSDGNIVRLVKNLIYSPNNLDESETRTCRFIYGDGKHMHQPIKPLNLTLPAGHEELDNAFTLGEEAGFKIYDSVITRLYL